MVLGCCVGSTMGINQDWSDVYNDQGLGYLIQFTLHPRGWAKFVLVIMTLSGIGMTCIAIYSASLSIQQFARPLAAVPRVIWTILVLIGILLLGLAGRDKLLAYLENFLSLLGYWNTSFFVILFSEHYIFRKGNLENYDLEAWNKPSRLPIGVAGLTAFLIGAVGWILGMVQTWYQGVLALKIGEYGGDIGNQLALVFTVVAYIPVRFLELKYLKR
jgi:purine-cytosine permease-like protein